MKKILYLLVAGATYYVGGLYRNQALTVLFLAELVLLPVLFCLSRYFRQRLSLQLHVHGAAGEKNSALPCKLTVYNRGILPVSRFVVKLKMEYGLGNREEFRNLQSREKMKKTLYGGCGRGQSQLSFSVRSPYCGLLRVQLQRMKVYDYLTLFGGKKKLQQTMFLAVFPKEEPLGLSLPYPREADPFDPREQTIQNTGQDQQEIRQIREYRQGEETRHIHWNQSARSEELYIKEFEQEAIASVPVFLDLSEEIQWSPKEADLFFETLAAVSFRLFRSRTAVKVWWYDGKAQTPVWGKAATKDQLWDVLLRLYGTAHFGEHEENAGTLMEREMAKADGIYYRLTSTAKLYQNQRRLL